MTTAHHLAQVIDNALIALAETVGLPDQDGTILIAGSLNTDELPASALLAARIATHTCSTGRPLR